MSSLMDVTFYRASVAALRTAVHDSYSSKREAYLHNKYGDKAKRAAMSADKRAYMLEALTERHPEWLMEDVFAPLSTWRVRESSLPPFPPAEIADAARRSANRRHSAGAASAASEDATATAAVATAPSAPVFAATPGCVLSFFEEDFRALALESTFREDALLFKFALLRRFDTARAAERFLDFRAVVLRHRLPLALSEDARRGIALGAFGIHLDLLQSAAAARGASLDSNGGGAAAGAVGAAEPPSDPTAAKAASPLMLLHLLPRRMDWDKSNVAQQAAGWFYTMMLLCSLGYSAQTEGLSICGSLKGHSPTDIKRDFEKIVDEALQKAIPARFRQAFIGHQSTVVDWVMWPAMKLELPSKICGRVRLLGKTCEPAITVFSAARVLREMGGTMDPVDPERHLAAVELVSRTAL